MNMQLGDTDTKQRKKPGPKPKQRDATAMTDRDRDQAGLSLDTRETDAHEAPRPKRVVMQGAMQLSIPAGMIKQGYTARWFRDKDARIAQADSAYWEHIKDASGNNLIRPSGPYIMHAMQLKNEYVAEDKALKRAKIAARLKKEAAIGANEYSGHDNSDSAIKATESSNPYS